MNTGDYAAFASEPVFFGEERIKAKALDDRAGCLVIMELLKEVWPLSYMDVLLCRRKSD